MWEQPEKPVPLQEHIEEVPADSAEAVDGPTKTEEVSASDASGTKETKGRKRFPFGLKFGKRAERAKSAERAIPAKTTQTTVVDGDEKVELAKPVEASASVPDVRLHVEAEGGDQSTSVTAAADAEKTNVQTDAPTKSGFKHELPHINIKWPHFGKKKQEEVVDPAAASEGEVKVTAPTDESDKISTPKKSQQQTPTSAPLTDSQKKSSLGKGIFKMFSPRRTRRPAQVSLVQRWRRQGTFRLLFGRRGARGPNRCRDAMAVEDTRRGSRRFGRQDGCGQAVQVTDDCRTAEPGTARRRRRRCLGK